MCCCGPGFRARRRSFRRRPWSSAAPTGTSGRRTRCSAYSSAATRILCRCFSPMASRATRCARTLSLPPGPPRRGLVPRSPASPTGTPQRHQRGAACSHRASPTRKPGGPAHPRPRTRRTRPPSRTPTDDGGAGGMTWPEIILRLALVLLAFLLLPLIVGQLEHKAMAHMQSRLGPMYAGGFHGWAQLIADGVKFVQKEDVIPAAADRAIFKIAPAVALVPYLVVLIVIPVGDGLVGVDLDAGLFFVLA